MKITRRTCNASAGKAPRQTYGFTLPTPLTLGPAACVPGRYLHAFLLDGPQCRGWSNKQAGPGSFMDAGGGMLWRGASQTVISDFRRQIAERQTLAPVGTRHPFTGFEATRPRSPGVSIHVYSPVAPPQPQRGRCTCCSGIPSTHFGTDPLREEAGAPAGNHQTAGLRGSHTRSQGRSAPAQAPATIPRACRLQKVHATSSLKVRPVCGNSWWAPRAKLVHRLPEP